MSLLYAKTYEVRNLRGTSEFALYVVKQVDSTSSVPCLLAFPFVLRNDPLNLSVLRHNSCQSIALPLRVVFPSPFIRSFTVPSVAAS